MPTRAWPTGADHQWAVIAPKTVERTLEEVYSPHLGGVAAMCAKLERALRYFTVAGIRVEHR